MIAYDLQCPNGHRFEGWFEDAKAFEKQRKKGLITCPVCDDTGVRRVPSTFAIKGTKSAAVPGIVPKNAGEVEMMARAVVNYVENNFDNVGTDFAKEALKIHFGASEPRNIRGISTAQEEETLRQEGVNFIKFPIPADTEKESSPESEN